MSKWIMGDHGEGAPTTQAATTTTVTHSVPMTLLTSYASIVASALPPGVQHQSHGIVTDTCLEGGGLNALNGGGPGSGGALLSGHTLGHGPGSIGGASGPNGGNGNISVPSRTSIQPRMTKQTLLSAALNGAMNAIAASSDGDVAVVAGREVLMTLRVGQNEIREVLNLRAGVRLDQNYSSNDVQWAGAYSRSVFATAATNSGVVLWDIRKSSKEKLDRIITEHARAVNRISFHPTDPLLLTASQDGSVKLWDLRVKGTARHTFEGRAESVRDVQFIPTGAFEFAAAFENGSVQKWDIRNSSQYERKWNAHNGLALTIDWGANGRFLASGSRDRVIKIWDTKSESRKAVYNIPTSAPVSRLKWRPGFDNQIASCALSSDNRIHVWDVSRPFVPVVSIEEHANVATDKRFCVQDIQHGYSPAALLSSSTHSWNVLGSMTFAVDSPFMDSKDATHHSAHQTHTPPSDGVEKRINPMVGKPGVHIPSSADKTIPVPEALMGSRRMKQVEGIVLHGAHEASVFIQLAKLYSTLNSSVWSSCEHNYRVAAQLGLSRSSQTWKLIQTLFNLNGALEDKPELLSQKSYQNSELASDNSASNDQSAMLFEDTTADEFDCHGERKHSSSTDPINLPASTDRESNSSDSSGSHQHIFRRHLLEISQRNATKAAEHALGSCVGGDTGLYKEECSQDRSMGADISLSSSLLNWKPDDLVHNLLEYYANIGNTQMCVTLVLVLWGHVEINATRAESYFWAYIDLLRRCRLWDVATEIITSCPFPSIRSLNQESKFDNQLEACLRGTRHVVMAAMHTAFKNGTSVIWNALRAVIHDTRG
ncbi:hypothetical protein BASA62_006308 [Batrachochytrium salamandrivorans]|nr:hypothetical protein BASA62_006308 [Batrachochytrium salamandrivorans]